MSIPIGIMGFGRIGRNLFRLLHQRSDIDVVAISDIADIEAMEYLLRYDTVHGRFPDPVSTDASNFFINDKKIQYVQSREPGSVSWKDLGVKIVIEATAKYRTRAWLEKHLEKGAERVVLTAPPDDDLDALVVRGVNDHVLKPHHQLISVSSVTANCASPILNIFHQNFGVKRAFMTCIHAYTNDQRLADVPHSDLRRSRAAAENIIPTKTHAPNAIQKIIPELEGKIEGIAMNVPVPDGSNIDLVCEMENDVTPDAVNKAVKDASTGDYREIVSFTDQPIVSSDVIGDTHSAIFDSLSTMVLGEKLLRSVTWFDNGWGYAQRVAELVSELIELKGVS